MAEQKVKFLDVQLAAGGMLKFIIKGEQTLTFDPARCNDAIQEQARLHGFNQKIRDAAAGFSKSGDTDGAFEAMDAVIQGLYAGSWNRKGGGGAGVIIEDLAHAIAAFKNAPYEKALAAVRQASPEQRAAWSKNAKIAALAADAKAKRLAAAADVATDEDLDGLDLE